MAEGVKEPKNSRDFGLFRLMVMAVDADRKLSHFLV
jgi:hypothetical protein